MKLDKLLHVFCKQASLQILPTNDDFNDAIEHYKDAGCDEESIEKKLASIDYFHPIKVEYALPKRN